MSTFSFSLAFSSFLTWALNKFFTRDRVMMACGTFVRVEQQWKTVSVKFMLDEHHYTFKEYLPTRGQASSIFFDLNQSWQIQRLFKACSQKHKTYCQIKFYSNYVECLKCHKGWDREDDLDLELQKLEGPITNETSQ